MQNAPINHMKGVGDLLLMRVLPVALLLVLVALAGCTGEDAPEPSNPEPQPGQRHGEVLDPDDPLSAYTWNGTNLIYDALEPPVPRSGTAWTYETGGVWDLAPEITVIAARDDDGGHILGGASGDELLNTAIWQQPWYGPVDAGLNRPGNDRQLFDWPLHDGQVFPHGDLMMSVVADLIDTPLGERPGYRIEGSDEGEAIAYTYVPEIGFLTSYSYGRPDGSVVWERLELKEIGTAEEAVWFEAGPRFSFSTHENPLGMGPNATVATHEMPGGYDEVLFVGLGTEGAQARAQALDPIHGGTWGFEDADGFWDWQVGRIQATPGPWLMSVSKGTEGWAYFEGVPVRWVDLDV